MWRSTGRWEDGTHQLLPSCAILDRFLAGETGISSLFTSQAYIKHQWVICGESTIQLECNNTGFSSVAYSINRSQTYLRQQEEWRVTHGCNTSHLCPDTRVPPLFPFDSFLARAQLPFEPVSSSWVEQLPPSPSSLLHSHPGPLIFLQTQPCSTAELCSNCSLGRNEPPKTSMGWFPSSCSSSCLNVTTWLRLVWTTWNAGVLPSWPPVSRTTFFYNP